MELVVFFSMKTGVHILRSSPGLLFLLAMLLLYGMATPGHALTRALPSSASNFASASSLSDTGSMPSLHASAPAPEDRWQASMSLLVLEDNGGLDDTAMLPPEMVFTFDAAEASRPYAHAPSMRSHPCALELRPPIG
jgi:hypothetical protein